MGHDTDTDPEALLARLVETPSVFPEEQDLARLIASFLQEQGFTVERQYLDGTDRFNLIAERGDPSIGIYGHMDTVPVQGNWSTDPFTAVVEHGRLYGLGAFDMKGGIAAALAAAARTDAPVRLLLGVDEEYYSRGAYRLQDQGAVSDLDTLIVPEIADTGDDHAWPVPVLGRRGRVVVEVTVDGASAHGARPEHGESAITRAAQLMTSLEEMPIREHPELGQESVFVRQMSAEAASLSIPETATFALDAHIVPPTTPASFLERVQDRLPPYAEAALAERPNPFLSPYTTDTEEVQGIVEAIPGEEEAPSVGYGLSVADENVFGQQVPVVVLGPRGGNAHAADEWVDLESVTTLTNIFMRVLSTHDG